MNKKWFRRLFRKRLIIIILLLIQIAFILGGIISGSKIFKAANVVMTIIGALLSLRIISKKDKSGYKLTWIFIILVFPLFGVSFYFVFNGQLKRNNFSKKYSNILNKLSDYNSSLINENILCEVSQNFRGNAYYLQNETKFPLFKNNFVKYLSPGEKMFEELINELKKAEKYIFLEYFIIQEGKMWNSILEILKEKAKQGVKVRVIYDDIGCFLKLPVNYKKILNDFGIECEVFNKFRPILTVKQNNRDHRKITVIDGKVAFTGGINLADEYINEKELYGYWKDSAVKIEGEAAWEFTLIFLQMWELITSTDEEYLKYRPIDYQLNSHDGHIQPYADNPKDIENVGEHVYLNIINKAKDYLYIFTPYLIIDSSLLSALKLASKNGLNIKIITPGKYDKWIVHMTTKSYYSELIESGVEVYEYQKGFMHSKIFLADDEIATIGTTNLDYRSLYLHFECGVCIYESKEISNIKNDFMNILKDSKKIALEDCKCGKLKTFFQEILRLFAPLM